MKMPERLTKRYIVKNLDNLELSNPFRYERYYINDFLRIQKKNTKIEKEILNENNIALNKEEISKTEFDELKKEAYKMIIRDSYLYIKDPRVSIKKYYKDYEGLIRVEVNFTSKEELESYQKESWMGEEITFSPLAFDKYLSKLNREEFLEELKKFSKKRKQL